MNRWKAGEVSGMDRRTPALSAHLPGPAAIAIVVDLTSLFLFGPHVASLVAAGILAARRIVQRTPSLITLVVNALVVVAALQGAGVVHRMFGGTIGEFTWPWQGAPIAAAVLVYVLIRIAAEDVLGPTMRRESVAADWCRAAVCKCSTVSILAGLAVLIAEIIDRQLYGVVPIVAVPFYLSYRAYCGSVAGAFEEDRRRQIIDSLEQGVAVIDANGLVTFWNEALVHLLGCPRDQVLGSPLATAIPALQSTALPRMLDEALADPRPRTAAHIGVISPHGPRIFQVRMLPTADGLMLLWNDVSERAEIERTLRRSEERLALAAEAANDGLWEWDQRTQECYFSARWKALLGMPATASPGRSHEWFERVHPDDLEGLMSALTGHLAGASDLVEHEHRLRHEDGTYRRYLCRGVRGSRRNARVAGSLTDITERTLVQQQVRNAGFLDPLTGLCNRAMFVEGLGRRLEKFLNGRGGGRFAVLYLDLDRFKLVNDSLGHLVGDELLIAASRRLETCLRQGDTLARLGGDEFAILLGELGDEQQANAIAFRIQKALSGPFAIGGREVFTSASIGIAFGGDDYTNPDQIMRDADTAMYHAKGRGKARHEVFDADMHARTKDRLHLENDLRRAVDGNEFDVHYQPIVALATGMCVGFESLIRWTRNGEPVSPAQFIPIAEELGLVDQIGTWVLQRACLTFADWQQRYPEAALECITVNVSSRQLMQQNFVSIVEQAIHVAKLNPRSLRIEITETALLDSPNVAAEVLRHLRRLGVKIYLDDFGTGYSSLSHLHTLPVDALKIDRSFVRSLSIPDRPAIVESILALARTMNTSVVAEGIESDIQAAELERLGCTHAQGYLFSRPLAPPAVEELLIANKPLAAKAAAVEDVEERLHYYSSTPFQWPAGVPTGRDQHHDTLTPT